MGGYILRRVGYAVPIAIAVSLICFSLVHLAPGDPLALVLPADATQQMADAVRQHYGLDQPLPLQYLRWIADILHGDLGTSISTGRPVITEIGSAIVYSLSLALVAAVIGFAAGIGMGVLAGYVIGTPLDRFLSAVAIAGVSVPQYWLGVVLVVLFAVDLNLLPAMGAPPDAGAGLLEQSRYILLPALTLAAMPAGIVTRSVRALVAETLDREFVAALTARG